MSWAVANSNLALVKYWGKADENAKRPASGSLSVTLDHLATAASVRFSSDLSRHVVEGVPDAAATRVRDFLDRFRERFDVREHAAVTLASNFPVAAGLASSASTFAALARAAVDAAAIRVSDAELADVARLGSGSACRSIYGGFVEWRLDGDRMVVEPIAPKEHWPLSILVAITSERPKAVGSSDGMRRTAATSPYYRAWIESGGADLVAVRAGVRERSLARVGTVAEANCLRMHAAAMASSPPLLYWQAATVAVIERVWELRARGVEAYFTIDAGPQVKVLCEQPVTDEVAAALSIVPGVLRILRSAPGEGVRLVEAPPPWVGASHAERARREVVAS
jgi:diphosphomevalonate decarboxylase